MKKNSIILGLILCMIYFNSKAQIILETEFPDRQDYSSCFDSVYQNVNFNNTPSGILYDRIIPFANLQYFGQQNQDTSFYWHFIQAYSELQRASLNAHNYLPFTVEELKQLNNELVIKIGIINFNFGIIDSSAIQTGKLYEQDGFWYENKAINTLFFDSIHTLVAAPLSRLLTGSSFTFEIDTNYIFSNRANKIVNLQIDFNDGYGYQQVMLSGQTFNVSYLSAGEKIIGFLISFIDGTIIETFARIKVVETTRNIATRWSHYPQLDQIIYAKIAYLSVIGQAEVRYYFANTDKKLRKPILIVDGFDPQDTRKFEVHKENDIWVEGGIWGRLDYKHNGKLYNVGDSLINLGYDIVMVNMHAYNVNGQNNYGGGDYIQRNAMTVIEVINEINRKLAQSSSQAEIVVVGPSMAGQITRYALKYMEKYPNINTNNGEHNCRLWISFDSPHLGANIAHGSQAFLHYFSEWSKAEFVKEKYDEVLCNVAAKQMLQLHIADPNQTWYNNYYQDINSLGYPAQLRKIVITNGSLNGTPTGYDHQLAMTIHSSAFIADIRMITATNSNQYNDHTFYGWHIGKLFGKTYKKRFGSICGIDAAPGGTYNSFEQIFKPTMDMLRKTGGVDVYENHCDTALRSHCFMPTASTLGYNDGISNLCDNIPSDIVTQGKTPFQSYWGPSNKNMDHVSFDSDLANYVFNEIETYISPGKRTISICDDSVQYSVHFPSGYTASVTWKCSSNLKITVGQNSKTVFVTPLSAGEGWIEATLKGNDILKYNKTLKRYSIEVKFEGEPITNAPETVTSSATWNSPYLVGSNLTISDNATLTLDNTNIYIAGGCKITVETGAKLIIDGATLTNACDDLWQGIIVKGDLTQQLTSDYQGYVEVKNNGKIENAVCGISASGGGMVKTDNANFINNQTGIKFLPPYSSQTYTSGSLSNTNFSYTQLTGFEQHLQVNGGGDINVNHCKFTGNNNKGVEIKNIPVNFGVNILEDATVSIQAGGILNLTDTMYFAGDATINVHQYGKLIVDGGILDKYFMEELQWKGITVMGVPNQPINQNYQGYAEFKNGAKILNAVTGITVQGGGSINVNNTQFINNKTGVKFEAINPANSGTSGTFTNTTFEINNNYLGNLTDFTSHLNMQKCANVNVSGCSFSVPQTIFNKNSILVNNTKSNWTNNNNLQSAKIYLLSGAEITNTGTINCKEKSNISISSGGSFTHKGNIYSSNNSEITVFSGGELIVDGGKLTNLYSETFWEGITVYGLTSTTPGEKSTDERGYIELKNSAKIENAICGITLKSGGVVNTHNAQFVNNKTGVKFDPFNAQNMISGTFSYTTFKIDDNFINGTQGGSNDRGVYSHLIMDNCRMVSVSSCNFSNTSSNIFSDGIIVKNTITNWSNNNTLRDVPLTLTDGATLTLTGKISNKDIDNDGIKVFSPSKLILDGGILTNISLSISLPDSNDFINLHDTVYSKSLKEEMWKGVAIYGGSTPDNTEMIELINGGRIENAQCGIMVNDYATVTANNAHFLNNTVGIKFNPLQNNSTFTSGTFNNANFELNNDYIGDDPFDTHIILENSGSVNIKNSVFSSTAIKKDTRTNKGIVAQNSNLIIGNISGFGAGTDFQFTGFNTAISATNTGNTRVFKVLNGVFENNLYGIAIDGIDNLEIVNNEFYLSDNESFGVTITNSTGYRIEENYFKTETNFAGTGNTAIGLHISNSGTEPNEVSLNTFDGVSIGQLFSGINGDEKFGTGLQSLCNTFTGRTGRIHDIYIGRYPTNNPGEIHLIAREQGNNNVPTGNTFSGTNPAIVNISNNSYPIPNIDYYHGRNSAELPTYNILTPISVDKEAVCESRYGEAKGGNEVTGVRYEVTGEEIINQSKSAQSVSSEFYLNDITLIPNPTTGVLQVTSYELQVTGIEVYDVYGKNLTPHTRYLAPYTSIDISDLASGVYFVKIYTNAGVVVKKVVKQ